MRIGTSLRPRCGIFPAGSFRTQLMSKCIRDVIAPQKAVNYNERKSL